MLKLAVEHLCCVMIYLISSCKNMLYIHQPVAVKNLKRDQLLSTSWQNRWSVQLVLWKWND